jgi:YgiT-type zinc finger domain-containing protein
MNCAICRNGQTHPGNATVTLQRGHTVVVIKEVPAEVCDNCGEHFTDEATTDAVLRRAELASQSGVEVEVLRFAA